MRVGGVSLTSLPGVKHPRPGGQLGGHVEYPLPIGQQPLRDRAPYPVRPLHCPDPGRPLAGSLPQLTVARGIRAEPARGPQNLLAVPGLDRDRQLVRVNPDDHLIHHVPLPRRAASHVSEDGQRYFELSRPFLSHASPRRPAGPHAMKEPHLATRRAAAIRALRPGTSPEPAPARAVLEDISSRDDGYSAGWQPAEPKTASGSRGSGGCVAGRGPAVFALAGAGRAGPVLLLPAGFVQRILDAP